MDRLADGHVTTPEGFAACGVKAGIKPSGNPDLTLIVSDRPAVAAGVFTTNLVRAYNVDRNRALLKAARPLRAVAVTSGNANVATGQQGIRDTERIAAEVATAIGVAPDEVAVAQTGVIGVPLPMERIQAAIPEAAKALDAQGGMQAAAAICTTDTHPKHSAVRVSLGGSMVTFGAIAKGAGMIHPNMATMLCFVTCDAAIAAGPLQQALTNAVAATLNAVTIDGDQSTSDTCLVLANGAAGKAPIESAGDPRWPTFRDALAAVLEPLAAMIARDGEGAEKLLLVEVTGARTAEDARQVARSVAGSSLVKCAVHGNDPNWGRIACAAGYAGVAVDQAKLGIAIGETTLLQAGEPVAFDAAAVSAVMREATVSIRVSLGLGEATGRAYGCDLTEAYVQFNAEYTT